VVSNERLIETRLPLSEIDEAARKEKKGSNPIFRLLFWWTRKPLVVSRAAVLGALLPKDYSLTDFSVQLGLSTDNRPFQYSPNIGNLSKVYSKFLSKEIPKILDPMAGGGSIPFEALRIGAKPVALEYNPVAYIILKATLEYPKKYGMRLVHDVEKWGMEVLQKSEEELGQLYPRHAGSQTAAYIWCWIAECKRCGQQNPLISRGRKGSPTEKMWVSFSKGIGVRPIFLEDGDLDFKFTKNPPLGTVQRGKSQCLKCGAPITNEHIKKEIKGGKRKLICVVVSSKRGKGYNKPIELDKRACKKAESLLNQKWEEFDALGIIPKDEIPSYDSRAIWVVNYGFDKWYKLFSSRQLLATLTIARQILRAAKDIERQSSREYAKAVVTYLVLTLCHLTLRNSIATLWNKSGEKIEFVFAFRGISMTWDSAEVNPFATEGSGVWTRILARVVDAIKFIVENLRNGCEADVRLGSVLSLPFHDEEFDLVATDPPYLDDVPYGELSEFYNVWIWRLLHTYYPELPGPKVPVDEELDDSPGRRGSKALSRQFYLNGLVEAFREMGRVLQNDGIMVLFFAHSKLEAWKILISSLIQAQFQVTMTWPVRTEPPGSVIQKGKASIQSSILVVARKNKYRGTAFLEDLKDKISEHVKEGLEEIADLRLIGADLIVAGLGKALEVATRFSELKSYSGNATLESLLEAVSEAVYSHSVEKFVDRPLAALDPQTAFYIFVKRSYGGIIPPDDALMLCKGAGVELEALRRDRIIGKKKLGTRTILTTLNAYERNLDLEKPPRTPTILDQLHLLELAVQKEGKKGFDRLVSTPAFRAGDVRAVAEGLYNGLLLLKKNDPEIELLRPIMDLFKTGSLSPAQDTMDKYFAEGD
jgi:adenine-specific DNA methylase